MKETLTGIDRALKGQRVAHSPEDKDITFSNGKQNSTD